ncbi:MAG: hypothetical protein Q8R66_04095 [Methanobacteriaceae archaeon]|nr:hypothetical protein [Methanobacteriaceae archaeon]
MIGLINFIKELKKDRRIHSFDESATKQAIILRILSHLDWNIYNIDEVYPEFGVENKKVDYALRDVNFNKLNVFIEVKKVGEDLEKHQNQLLDYSFKQGVKLAILTNGMTWWFYLPLNEGSWEQRKFYTIEIQDQESEQIINNFQRFLQKKNVISGKSVEYAEKIHKSKQTKYLINKKLPEAWNKLISEKDESLIDLLAETTEKICGYKPDHMTVDKYLSSLKTIPYDEIHKSKNYKSKTKTKTKITPNKPNNGKKNFSGKNIVYYTFNGQKYDANTYISILNQLSEHMLKFHERNFNQVLSLKGTKRPYFTKNKNELRIPKRIDNSDIFMETNLSANHIVKICRDLISVFGYSEESLEIKTED